MTREISQGTCKLTRTPTLKKYIYIGQNYTLAKLVISKKKKIRWKHWDRLTL
jgi:hypothetical protein